MKKFITNMRQCYRLLHVRPRALIITILIALVLLLLLIPQYTFIWKAIKSQNTGVYILEFTGFNERGPGQNLSEKICVHPVVDPYDPLIMQHHRKVPPVNCSAAMKDWVYITNGIFHISRDAIRLYGNITCHYAAIQPEGDFSVRYWPVLEPMLDGTPLKSDFFWINCTSSSGKQYSNFHSAVVKNPAVMKRLHDYHSTANKNHKTMQSDPGSLSQSPSSLNLSIFMLGFDSVSRMAWMRLLPKSRKYFVHTLGGIELENYNIVGDGTTRALLPILTGRTEEELPESRRGHKNPNPVDQFPWVWKDFVKHGYVTAYAEDMPWGGTFQWKMLGFRNQPTDHYMRPYHLSAATAYRKNIPLCLGSLKRHSIFMNWFRDLFDTYRYFPKFFFGFHAEISHYSTNSLQVVDDDLKIFLQDLEAKGHLNSTLLILMSDHGPRFHATRSSDIGKLEERLPYFAFRFPPSFHKRHPDIIKNMRTNAKRLTTPFDIHATFLDVLNQSLTSAGDGNNRSFSLLEKVPKERTCADADIAPHWCACLEWEHVNTSDTLVVLAADASIDAMNSYTQFKRTQCAELSLHRITKSVRYVRKSTLSWKVFNFINKPLPASAELYQVSFETLPGEGHFEVTCAVDPNNRMVFVDAKEISRINRYRSQAACIAKTFPCIRPYCYCR